MAHPAEGLEGQSQVTEVLGSRSRPDLSWVSRVAGVPMEEAVSALESIGRHRAELREMAGQIAATGRAYYAQFPAPLDLYTLLRLVRPAALVESGVASGVSSTFLLLGTKSNGRGTLHSMDYPVRRTVRRGGAPWALPEGADTGWGVPRSLTSRWDLHLGRSEDLLLPLLKELGRLDFYCHDSPVDLQHFRFEMKAIRRYLRPGSVVVADNTDWDTFESTARMMGAKAYRRRSSSLGGFRVPRTR